MNDATPSPALDGVIVDGVHHLALRVYYEDTDAAGIVYYANYLRWMERGRSSFMRMAGVTHQALAAADEPVVLAVKRCAIDYRRPAKLDDDVTVESRVTRLRGASIEIAQDVLRGTEMLTVATVVVAALTPQGFPTRLPLLVRSAFAGDRAMKPLAPQFGHDAR